MKMLHEAKRFRTTVLFDKLLAVTHSGAIVCVTVLDSRLSVMSLSRSDHGQILHALVS